MIDVAVAELACILIYMGVSSCAVVTEMSLETYTYLLMDASPEFPIHFLNIYSFKTVYAVRSLSERRKRAINVHRRGRASAGA